MHPLLDSLNRIKQRLLTEDDEAKGNCLDLFTLPNDMQIYASSAFSHVTCVASCEHDLKLLRENVPTRPPTLIDKWTLDTPLGRILVQAATLFVTPAQSLDCIWIHLHRFDLNANSFQDLMQRLYARCNDHAILYVFCMDATLARQLAKAGRVCVPSRDTMLLQYHRQTIPTLSLKEIIHICEKNSFLLRNQITGTEILDRCNINCLPYDRWSSEAFSLLQFESKSHFRTLSRS